MGGLDKEKACSEMESFRMAQMVIIQSLNDTRFH